MLRVVGVGRLEVWASGVCVGCFAGGELWSVLGCICF